MIEKLTENKKFIPVIILIVLYICISVCAVITNNKNENNKSNIEKTSYKCLSETSGMVNNIDENLTIKLEDDKIKKINIDATIYNTNSQINTAEISTEQIEKNKISNLTNIFADIIDSINDLSGIKAEMKVLNENKFNVNIDIDYDKANMSEIKNIINKNTIFYSYINADLFETDINIDDMIDSRYTCEVEK